MRCGFNIVNLIMHLSAERGMKRRNYSQVSFEHLSINEKSFKKGHITSRYSVTRLQDVLDIEKDRTKESCKKLFEKSLTTEQLG
ncbi:MAG: transposase [Algoriphagus sp.]|jgi:transposase